MKIHPSLRRGVWLRDWVELAVRVEKVKREVARSFGYEWETWAARRRRGL